MTLFLLLIFVLPLHAFLHPGLLVSNVDITRIKRKLAEKKDPWLASWTKLTSLEYASPSYSSNAVPTISRTTEGTLTANAQLLWHDVAAAFILALRWKVEGNTSCADTAVDILNSWATTLKGVGTEDDNYLLAGFQGHELANAAELLQDYPPFQTIKPAVSTMLTSIFLEKNLFFLNHLAGSEHNVKHFFANWELGSMASAMAIGVFTDNQTTFDFVVDYFKNGTGNGAIGNAITNIVTEPGTGKSLGQGQEAGRDQGHAGLDFQMLAAIGQQAYNQGEDLFGFADDRILLGAEYYARYNLGEDVPFVPYTNGIVSFNGVSNASRGATRPTWELLYAHYRVIKGLDTPWTEKYRNHTIEGSGGIFESGIGLGADTSGNYDGIGWGTLLHRLDEDDLTELQNSTASETVSSKVMAASSIETISTESQISSTSSVITSSAREQTTTLQEVSTTLTQTSGQPLHTSWSHQHQHGHLPGHTHVGDESDEEVDVCY